jgi:hypothetical protein
MRGVISIFAVAIAAVAAVLALAAGPAAAATCRAGYVVSQNHPHQGLRQWTVVQLYETGIGCTEAKDLVYWYLGHEVKPVGYECRYAGITVGSPSDHTRALFVDCWLTADPKKTFFAEYKAGFSRW